MRVAFRVDSSIIMGSGHVMRCLTLATVLRNNGALVCFICRCLPGNLCDFIESQGITVHRLTEPKINFVPSIPSVAHASWLGVDWHLDAEETKAALEMEGEVIDWLIIDHYALDKRWEESVRSVARHIMVIDDLADRPHDCDLLLDQNLYKDMASRYDTLVPETCRKLLGPQYALLRPEFAELRERALVRRREMNKVDRILVSFGGTDPDNVTGVVLEGIEKAGVNVVVDVVMGCSAPWLKAVHAQAAQIQIPVELHVATHHIAQLMYQANVAVGAGGSTTWERCCLGLPSVLISSAENQISIAQSIANHDLGIYLGRSEDINVGFFAQKIKEIISTTGKLKIISTTSQKIVDGKGTIRVMDSIS